MINYSRFPKQFISPLESKLMKKRQNIKKCHFKAFFSSKKNAKKRHHGVLPMYAHFAPLKNANFASKNLQNRSFQTIKSIISNHQISYSKSSNQSFQIIVLIISNRQINCFKTFKIINHSQFPKQFISPLESKLMKKRQNIKKCHFKAFFSSKKNAKKRHHGVLPMYAHFAPLKNANFASKNLQNRSFQTIKSIISNHQISYSKLSNQSFKIIKSIISNHRFDHSKLSNQSVKLSKQVILLQIIKINHKIT